MIRKTLDFSLLCGTCILLLLCSGGTSASADPPADPQTAHSLPQRLVQAAVQRTRKRVLYSGTYRKIAYPGGDIPAYLGVCTDLVVRAYRALGIDLQIRVHEDMAKAFTQYPNHWNLKGPDTNIDHRRVPNLETFFTRSGSSLPLAPISGFLPGDVVSWRLPGGAPHIGIVHSRRSKDGKRPLIIHNIGRGPVIEDSLTDYPLVGHFRYFPTPEETSLP